MACRNWQADRKALQATETGALSPEHAHEKLRQNILSIAIFALWQDEAKYLEHRVKKRVSHQVTLGPEEPVMLGNPVACTYLGTPDLGSLLVASIGSGRYQADSASHCHQTKMPSYNSG